MTQLLLVLLLARPAAAKTPPPSPKVPVRVGVYITNLIGVEEVAETFKIRGYIYETWRDPRLSYKPRGPLDASREVEPESIWKPNVIVANAVSGRSRIGTNARVRPDGTVDYWEDFQDDLTMQLVFRAFPFDSQTLPVVIQPFLDERDSVELSPDPAKTGIGTQPWALLAQWGIAGVTVTPRRALMGKDGALVVPELEFDLGVDRRSAFYLWKVFLPLFIMAAIAYCALWLRETDHAPQLSVAMSALLTQVAFLFVISNSLPRVPYLTYIDAFFLISFLFAFCTLIELVVVHQALEGKRVQEAVRVRRLSRILFPVGYFLSHAAAAWLFFAR